MMKTLSFTMGALLAACNDNQLNALRKRRAAGCSGHRGHAPARIDFGAVTDAEGVAVQAITISSVAGSDLVIEDISIRRQGCIAVPRRGRSDVVHAAGGRLR
jgi:hypothetical protein